MILQTLRTYRSDSPNMVTYGKEVLMSHFSKRIALWGVLSLACRLTAFGALQTQTDSLHRDTVLLQGVGVSRGYQAVSAERITGSFERVGEKLLDRQIGPDVISRLDGVVPGLLFDTRGGGAQLRVRGLSSLGTTDSR